MCSTQAFDHHQKFEGSVVVAAYCPAIWKKDSEEEKKESFENTRIQPPKSPINTGKGSNNNINDGKKIKIKNNIFVAFTYYIYNIYICICKREV